MPGTNDKGFPKIAPDEVHAISARLARFTDELLFGDVWERPGLTPRDRSFVTCASAVSTDRSAYLSFHGRRALDNGVTPRELGELVTHLNFYCGWPAGTGAAWVLGPIFSERGITPADVAPSDAPRLAPPASFKAAFDAQIRAMSPELATYTRDVIYQELWCNPDLSLRDRGLATVVALVSMGKAQESGIYLDCAMDSGLSEEEFDGAMTHLAFYAGWAKVTDAMAYFRGRPGSRKGRVSR